MATTIKLKKSSVSGRIPSSGDLEYGEIAINYADGIIYYKASDNSIRSISGNSIGVDSAATIALIDSAYVQARQSATGGTDPIFKTISVAGQSDIVADVVADTLTIAAGNNVSLTTDAGSDTLTITGDFDSDNVVGIVDSDYVVARQLKSHSIGGKYRFDTSTTAGDPGSGDIRFSIDWTTGTQGSSYNAYVSETDKDGVGIAPLLDQLTVSTNTNKALVIIYKADAPTTNAKFYVTGQTDNGSFRTLDITYVDRDAWGLVSNGDEIFMAISIIGDTGNAGIDSAGVINLIDSSYVQLRQNFAYSSLTGAPTALSSFTNDTNYLDSTTVQGVIDASYIQTNQIKYTTADFTDSNYVNTIAAGFLDSAEAVALIDSAYVQLRQASTDLTNYRTVTQINALIDSGIDALINGAPGALDTLNELAAALGDDADFATTVTNSIASKIDSANAITIINNQVDSAYVQLRQTAQDFAYSSLTGAPNVLDSTDVSSIITADVDQAFINALGITATDSAQISAIILEDVDSAYVQLRQDFAYSSLTGAPTSLPPDGVDSAPTIDLIQATIDNGYIATIVDSNYVIARQVTVSGGATTLENYYYTADSGQTTFTGSDDQSNTLSYTVDKVQVYLNGILLRADTDYTATSGTSIVLTEPVDSGDDLSISTYTTSAVGTLDSTGVTNLIDSAYIQARQTAGGGGGTDSATVSAIITADVDKAFVDALNVDADTLDGVNSTSFLRSDADDTFTGTLSGSGSINITGPIASSDSAIFGGDGSTGGVKIDDGAITIRTGTGNVAYVDLYCEVSNAHRTRIKSAAHSEYSGNVDVTLPTSTGTLALTSDLPSLGNDFVDSAYVTSVLPTLGNDFVDSSTARSLLSGGTGVTYNSGTGEISIGQAVGTTDNVTFADMTVDNLTVSGTTTTVNSITYTVTDPLLHLADSNEASDAVDIGFIGHYSPDGGSTREHTGFFRDASNAQYYIFNGLQDSAFDSSLPTNIVNRGGTGFELATLNVGTINGVYSGFDSDVTAAGLITASDISTTVDSAYVQLRQDFAYSSLTGAPTSLAPDGVDSAPTIDLINATINTGYIATIVDSAYVIARTTALTDSAAIINLIDSAYVAARAVGVDGGATTIANYYYTADSGQITFSGSGLSYTAGKIQVYLNGILLKDSDDYTATNGTSITLSDSADINDILSVITYTTQSVGTLDSVGVLSLINQNPTLDSAEVIQLIDSDYIQLRQSSVTGGATTITNYYYTADSGQISFSGSGLSYTAGEIQVYLNGILLKDSDDYTASNGTSIVLSDSADVNDILSVITYTTAAVGTLDSAGIIELIDSSYIAARAVALTDSAAVSSIIEADVDSAYVQLHAKGLPYSSISGRPTFATVATTGSYSDLTSLPDLSVYATENNSMTFTNKSGNISQWTNDANYLDSTTVQGVINASYIQSNQITYNTSDFADSAFVTSQINSLINGAPGALDTLNELAAALGDDADFATTITNQIAGKLDSAQTVAIIDSAYIQLRQDFAYSSLTGAPTALSSFTNDTNYLDSNSATTLIDSDYIELRRPAEAIFNVVNNGSSAYTFTGDGFSSGDDNPTLYLQRGLTYKININAASHPLQIRVSNGGAAYSTGVTGNGSGSGEIIFTPDMNAPNTLVYQCTVHSGMVGNIIIVDDQSFLDSSRAQTLIDASVKDSAFVTGIVTTSYVNSLGITAGLDSATIINLIDSAYIQAREAAGGGGGTVDSADIIAIVDSDYIQARQSTVANGVTSIANYLYTADSAQTNFTGVDDAGSTLSYTAGQIQVYLNGILLRDSDDYTASNGTSVLLNTGANLNDELSISKFFLSSAGTDSAAIINLIDSDYVAARSPAGTDSAAVISIIENNTSISPITFTFTADSDQTSFSGADDNGTTLSYSAGYQTIFLNGILLIDSDDYTATNGTSIVLTSEANLNDKLSVVTYKTVLSTVRNTDIDNFYFTSDSGQTTFAGADDNSNTLSYTADKIQVYLNGVLLKDSDDYTAENGSTIVLSSAIDSGDILAISAYSTSPVTLLNQNDIETIIDSDYVSSRAASTAFAMSLLFG